MTGPLRVVLDVSDPRDRDIGAATAIALWLAIDDPRAYESVCYVPVLFGKVVALRDVIVIARLRLGRELD
jgi:hypothetical protein